MNTFGDSQNQFPIYDAQSAIIDRGRFRRGTIRDLVRVNSFYCPGGRHCFRGWLLMARADYNELDHYSTSLELNIGDTEDANNIGTLKNLAIVQAQCVTRGLAADPNALFLIEITD